MTNRFDRRSTVLRKAIAIGTAAGIALFAGASAGAGMPGEGVKVRPIINHTTEELFQTYIVGRGLEALGYELEELKFAQVQLAQVAVAQNDADYYPSHWNPLHKAFHEESGGDAKMQKVGVLIEGALQGYLIDKKTADEKGIKLLDQLKDPETAKLFDVNGDGIADLYGCEPGWGCERVIEHQLTAYGLRDTVSHQQGGYFAIIPDAIERIRAGNPTLYYTWTPMWLSGVLRPGARCKLAQRPLHRPSRGGERGADHRRRTRQPRIRGQHNPRDRKHRVSRGQPGCQEVVRAGQGLKQ